jgi:hypothetical protein
LRAPDSSSQAVIGLQFPRRVEGADDVEIGRNQRQRGIREARLHQPRDSGQPFATTLRLAGGEIVESGAGMAVDDAKRRRLLLQMDQDAHQRDVLDNIGKAAGMKGVTVVHGG